jgi:DNA-binding NarL/FixJ family response regulator
MRPRTVVVVHREAMAAEGIAAALARYPAMVPIAAAVTLEEGERAGAKADAVAIDHRIPGAERTAQRLRRAGVRVVFLSESDEDHEDVRVSPLQSVAALAAALAPGVTEPVSPVPSLTARQREILSLAARGLAAKQIARQLGISAKTVERHKTKLFATLGVTNQTAAVSRMLGAFQGGAGWVSSST